ncbi:hypothetical protein ACFW9I_31600 [[Kitasatospora] papulosa]|uniref:hypothetical protein n=1 Tax=[Kitasatospora] papulosa TaxID=1464011 RepID=UPI00368DD885
MNKATCGTSRPLTAPEAAVLIVIIIVAAVLAAAGMPTVGVLVLVLEAMSLGRRLLVRLRHGRATAVRHAQA